MNEIAEDRSIRGVYAALLTPREADLALDRAALVALIRFVCSRGISSFAVNGATGEFCLTTPEQLRQILDTIREAAPSSMRMLCGIGAPSCSMAVELARIAEAAAADGLLLPMPYFFRYEQTDLEAFCREVAASTSLPILLYNLPQFTSGLEKETVQRLVAEVPNIVGIKDSGNSSNILSALTLGEFDAVRMVGNDSMLPGSLQYNLCDGVVSGVACVLPELVLALYAERADPTSARFLAASRLLTTFLERINELPIPWALKWMAEVRGLGQSQFAQPISPSRAAEGYRLMQWAELWYRSAMEELEIVDTRFAA